MFGNFYGSFCAVISGICLVAQPLQAEQTYGDFIYTKSAEGVTITDFINSAAEEVVIPASIDGKPVISIGSNAFYRHSLTSVRIPESVTHIGDNAFCFCYRLMNLNLPSGLTSVGGEAFAYCESLLSITMPPRMRDLGPGAFSFCRRLRSVSISPSLANIKNGTFFYCLALSSITIPEGVTQIWGNALGGCDKLKKVTFLGDAPGVVNSAFPWPAAEGFTIFCLEGSTGFSTPIWKGYACEMISPTPEIEVMESAGTLRADGNARRNFGKMFLGSSKRVKTFTVTNTGTAHLTDLVVKIKGVNPGDFKLITPIKSSLRVDETTTFKVAFKPIRTGSRSAVLHITSDEMKSDPFDIKLIGRGKKLSNTEETIK